MEDIHRATRRYEEWLGGKIPLVRGDLRAKHQRMRLGPFLFMRATFYRWCQLWQATRQELGDAARAAPVAAVGDLHLENFGTWRDSDGRLIWGINDFDEATTLPCTQDLIRLAASVHLAILTGHLAVRRRNACQAILEGYRAGVETGGQPYVLEEAHGWLRSVALGDLRHPTTFWQKMNGLRTAADVDRGAAAVITGGMPAPGLSIRFARRVAGMGSLGRPRFVGIAAWRGGWVAREAKAMAPSAWVWASGKPPGGRDAYSSIISRAVRVPDPTVRVVDGWLVRRLAPHCARIELAELPSSRDEERLLYAMGFETANVHLGTPRIRETLRRQLAARRGPWLHEAAKLLSAEVVRDWRDWHDRIASAG
ncbi:MAG TPA: DUF2252 family protein [Polyangia bacterium]|nr:DUF2252 family protein [Polyangia bacterium]